MDGTRPLDLGSDECLYCLRQTCPETIAACDDDWAVVVGAPFEQVSRLQGLADARED